MQVPYFEVVTWWSIGTYLIEVPFGAYTDHATAVAAGKRARRLAVANDQDVHVLDENGRPIATPGRATITVSRLKPQFRAVKHAMREQFEPSSLPILYLLWTLESRSLKHQGTLTRPLALSGHKFFNFLR